MIDLRKIRNVLAAVVALGGSFVGGEYHMAGRATKLLADQRLAHTQEIEGLKKRQADETREFRSEASRAFVELKLLRDAVKKKAASDAEFGEKVRRALPWPAPWLELPQKKKPPSNKRSPPKKPGLKIIPTPEKKLRGKGEIAQRM